MLYFSFYLCKKGNKLPTPNPNAPVVEKKPANVLKKVFSADRDRKLIVILQKMPPATRLKELMMKLDTTEISLDKIDVLIKSWPSEEEKVMLLDEYKNDPNARWDRPEAYVLHMISAGQLEMRFWIWKYILAYPEEKDFIAEFGSALDGGFKVLKESKTFKVILGITLSLGNILNGGTARGQADGFNIDVLSRLSNLADINKKSALSFLATELQKQMPEVMLSKEFEFVIKAQRFNLKDLETKTKTLTEGFKGLRIKNDVISKQTKEPKTDQFLICCAKFITEAEVDITKINEFTTKLSNEYKSMLELFRIGQEDDKSKSTEEFFKFFANFIEQLDKIIAEDRKQARAAEMKKQAAQSRASPKKEVKHASGIQKPEEKKLIGKTEIHKSGDQKIATENKPNEPHLHVPQPSHIPQTATSITSALAKLRKGYNGKDD